MWESPFISSDHGPDLLPKKTCAKWLAWPLTLLPTACIALGCLLFGPGRRGVSITLAGVPRRILRVAAGGRAQDRRSIWHARHRMVMPKWLCVSNWPLRASRPGPPRLLDLEKKSGFLLTQHNGGKRNKYWSDTTSLGSVIVLCQRPQAPSRGTFRSRPLGLPARAGEATPQGTRPRDVSFAPV